METNKDIYQISHTKLATFRRCLQQFHWKYIDHYYPKSSIGQSCGTTGHAALAEWHTHHDSERSLKAAWNKWLSLGYREGEDWENLQNILTRYFEWSKVNDSFQVIESEFKFELLYGEEIPVLFIGFIDGIVVENGRTWLLENKFNKRASTSNLELDAQATLYLMAANFLEKNAEGVIYNIVRMGDTKIAQKEPAIRARLYRSRSGLDRVSQEIYEQAKIMLKYEKEGGIPYRNPTKDCSWDCPFYSACLSMQDDGIEPSSLLEYVCSKGD